MRRPGIVAAAIVALAIVAPAARGDSRHRKEDVAWARGVSDEAQTRALSLFHEGNKFYEQARYTEAVVRYEEALKSWDHPSIRFNMAVCLINMRQPLDAFDHLTQAMRFGDVPLGKDIYAQAKSYMSLLEASLAQVSITVTQPDVKVMVDGKELQIGQGTKMMRLLAGRHQLVATKNGFETESRPLDLPPGKATNEEVSLHPIKEHVKVEIQRENYERRFSWWVPWAVAGGGVAVGLIGTGVYVDARNKGKRYDNALGAMCPAGCTDDMIPASLSDEEKSARRLSQVGIALWTVGGVAVLGGAVLAVLNRPKKMEEHKVMPQLTVSKDHVSIGISFVLD